MITLKNIEKVYGTGTNTFKALDGIDLEIKKGEFVAIVGASGSGKSTLLNIIGCMDSPTGGEYFFENENILNKKYKQLAAFRNKKIGFVFQAFNLADDCTAAENVEITETVPRAEPWRASAYLSRKSTGIAAPATAPIAS